MEGGQPEPKNDTSILTPESMRSASRCRGSTYQNVRGCLIEELPEELPLLY